MAEEVQMTQEEKDDQIINEAFQKLLNDYISSRHRKKVDLPTLGRAIYHAPHRCGSDSL